MATRKAIVLVSGGLDSSVVLAMVRAQGYDIAPLFFDYGQKALVPELHRAQRIVEDVCPGKELIVRSLKPVVREVEGESYVPARNLVFFSAAAAEAIHLSATHIFAGIISSEGPDGCEYSDCSAEFLESVNLTLQIFDDSLSIHTPLLHTTKEGVFGLAEALGVDYSLTFSCLTPKNGVSCRECCSCVERSTALKLYKKH